MVKLDNMINASRVIDLESDNKDEVLVELVDVLVTSSNAPDRDAVLSALQEREKQSTTGIGNGIAVPHVKIPEVKDFVISIGRSNAGIEYNAVDQKPVNLVFLIAANDKQCGEYLKILAEIMRRCKDSGFREKILSAKSPKEIVKEILNYS